MAKENIRSTMGMIVEEIRRSLSQFAFCYFSHVRREGNKVAHALACLHSYDMSMGWGWAE